MGSVQQVLTRLLENRLVVKAQKCEFHANCVPFLGLIIQGGSMKADPEKIRTFVEWPIPANRTESQHLLGLANFYRRFVRDYSKIASSLTKLTSSMCFHWSSEADKAFERLKKLFEFTITYRSGPRNCKSAALSLQFSSDHGPSTPVAILPEE